MKKVMDINLSKLKNGWVSTVRFSTLNAPRKVLHCQSGDIEGIHQGERSALNDRKGSKAWRGADHVGPTPRSLK